MLSLARTVPKPAAFCLPRKVSAIKLCRMLLLACLFAAVLAPYTSAFAQEIQPAAISSFEGSLIKAQDQAPIYYVRGGLKHWVLDPKWVRAHRRLAANIKILPPEIVNSIPSGAPFTYVPPQETRLAALLAVVAFCFLTFVLKFRGRLQQYLAKPIDCCGKDYVFRAILLAIFVLCILLRSMHLLVHPRFWAEEGVIWFQYDLQHSAGAMLLYVYNLSGYMNFAANVAGVLAGGLARSGHIVYAPLASSLFALMLQFIPFLILCLGNSRLFNSRWKLIVGGLFILTLPAATPEIWLNSINSMSFTGLIAFLLLFEDNTKWTPAGRWAVRALLVFCGLTGIYALVLAPFFLAYYFVRRSREHAIQGLILSVVGVIQAGVVIYFKLHSALPMRGEAVPVLAPINVLYYTVVAPFVGQDFARLAFRFFGLEDAWWVANSYPHWPDESTLLAGWVSAIVIAIIVVRLCRREYAVEKLLLAGIFVSYATVTTLGSLHGIISGRYAFLPSLAMLMLVFSNLDSSRFWFRQLLCCIAIAMALSVGVMRFYDMQMFAGPSWRDEVAKWEKDYNYGMRVWPSAWGPPIHYRPTR